MNDTDQRLSGAEVGTPAQEVTGGFIQSVGDIFLDPMKVFQRIDSGLAWWKAYVLTVVVSMFAGWLTIPFTRHLVELNERGLSEQQLQRTLEGMDKFSLIGLIMVPITIIILYAIIAGIGHLLISIFSSYSNFRKTLSLVAYCGIITTVEQIINTVILKVRGVEAVETASDLQPSLSLAAFFPELEGFWRSLLQSLGIFQIWYYILFVLGVAAIFKIKRGKALVPAVVLWLISLIVMHLFSSLRGT